MGRRATTIVGRSRRFLDPSDAGRGEIVLEAPLMLVLATLALMAGSRAAWIFLAFVAVGDIAVVVFGETRHPTTTFMLNAVALGLLLAPSTRRWLRWSLRSRGCPAHRKISARLESLASA